MRVPYQDLQPDTLRNLVEEIVTRDGTDYGVNEVATTQKVEQVLRQLHSGKVVIVFDGESESCAIIDARDYREPAAVASES